MIVCHLTNDSSLDYIKENGLVPQIGLNQKYYCVKYHLRMPTTPIIYFCLENEVVEWSKRLYEKSICLICDIPKEMLKKRKNGELLEIGCFENVPFEFVKDIQPLEVCWHENPLRAYKIRNQGS